MTQAYSSEERARINALGQALKRDRDGPAGDAYREWRATFGRHLDLIQAGLRQHHSDLIVGGLAGRLKEPEAVVAKMRRRNLHLADITDIAGVRVVVRDRDNQEKLTSALHQAAARSGLAPEVKRHDSRPYEGQLGCNITYRVGDLPFELQIQTALQHSWNRIVENYAVVHGSAVRYGKGPVEVRNVLNGLAAVTAAVESKDFKSIPKWLRELDAGGDHLATFAKVSKLCLDDLSLGLKRDIEKHISLLATSIERRRERMLDRVGTDVLQPPVDVEFSNREKTNVRGAPPPPEPYALTPRVSRDRTEREDTDWAIAQPDLIVHGAKLGLDQGAQKASDQQALALREELRDLVGRPEPTPSIVFSRLPEVEEAQRSGDSKRLAALSKDPAVEACVNDIVARQRSERGRAMDLLAVMGDRFQQAEQRLYPERHAEQLAASREAALQKQLEDAESHHLDALIALQAYRQTHPDLAARPFPGTRAHELTLAEHETAAAVARVGSLLDRGRQLPEVATRRIEFGPTAHDVFESATNVLERAARAWASFKSRSGGDVTAVYAARCGEGPGASAYSAYRQAYENRRRAIVELEVRHDRKPQRNFSQARAR